MKQTSARRQKAEGRRQKAFLLPDGKQLICRSEGAVVQPATAESPAVNLIRLENRASATGEFVLLNQKIHELSKEIYQRQKAQSELVQKNEELQDFSNFTESFESKSGTS